MCVRHRLYAKIATTNLTCHDVGILKEVRALLDLLSENQSAVQNQAASFKEVLERASSYLTILAPEVGDKELIKSVSAELANLHEMAQPGVA